MQMIKVPRPAGAPTYTEPMVIIGIVKQFNGEWVQFEPYVLSPEITERNLRAW